MRRVQNRRLYPWPAVCERREDYLLKVGYLSPGRFRIAENLVILPLMSIWSYACLLLVISLILESLKAWSVFHYLEYSKLQVWSVIVGGWVLWQYELISCYFFTRLFFSKPLTLRTDGDTLFVKRRFRTDSFSLDMPVTFGLRPLANAEDKAFKASQCIELIIDQSKRYRIAVIIDGEDARKIVANANTMLLLKGTDDHDHYDLDPTLDPYDDY